MEISRTFFIYVINFIQCCGSETVIFGSVTKEVTKFLFIPVVLIRIDLHMDPDPAFEVNMDSDSAFNPISPHVWEGRHPLSKVSFLSLFNKSLFARCWGGGGGNGYTDDKKTSNTL